MIVMYRVNESRIRELASILDNSLDLIRILEVNDPQYIAIKKLVENIGCNYAVLLIIGNALISYQLSSRGEVYWTAFSRYVSQYDLGSVEDALNIHIAFLKNTRYNVMSLEHKIKRLKKYYKSRLTEILLREPLRYCGSIDRLVSELSNLLGSSRDSKTIVFAGKIYYYVCRICGAEEIRGDIPIPVDRRIAYLSLTSCLITGCNTSLRECIYDLMKPGNRRIVIDAWMKISSLTGIPSYSLDTLLWILGRFIGEEKSVAKITSDVIAYYPNLGKYRDKLHDLIVEFTKCLTL